MRFFVFAFVCIAAVSAASISTEYLPPLEDNNLSPEYIPPADDGYRYKVVRRLRLRHRRDVSELPANEYLPPVAEAHEAVVIEAPEENTVLADDGYRYKVVRRLKYRHRRDVSELPSVEYLPPVVEAHEAVAVEAPLENTVLAQDGYRYKVVRRLRHRRH